jgi:hypothetical protein
MDQLPLSFNFTEYEGLLQNKIDKEKEEALSELRKYVSEQLKISVNNELDYCMIDLAHRKPSVRETLLKEILQRFPTVGYVSEFKSLEYESHEGFQTYLLYSKFTYRSYPPSNNFIYKISDKNFAKAIEKELFVIACTQKYANQFIE